MANPIMNAKIYARITGIALAAVAVLGIILSAVGDGGKFGIMCSTPSAATCDGGASNDSFLAFDWTHNILHVVLAIVALAVGFGNVAGNYVKMYAQVFGVVYLALAIGGFFMDDLLSFLGVHLELGENLVHLVIGLWGVVAGFFGTTQASGATTTTSTPRRV